MNPLLKRQIEKHLPKSVLDDPTYKGFFKAVEQSYNTYEDQFKMIQRTMEISSEELYEANEKLSNEGKQQKELIQKLQKVINTLKLFNLNDNIEIKGLELDGTKLVDYINNQASQLVDINNEQQKLLNELELQNQELNDYAHIVSHDLKSPLRSIDALLNWLREDYDEVLDEKGKEKLRLIETHLEKMDNLIDGILRYSSIDKHAGSEETINLAKVIKEIISILPIPNHIEIEVQELPEIEADYFKIQQLFQNLICNAAGSIDKPNGLIQVTSEENEDYWLFSVKDNGKGIDEKYFDKIFQVFQKLETQSTSTGIGLSIVKKVVNFYKGRIWLESELGKGSTFFFTISKN